MSRTAKKFAVVAVVVGILALSLGSIAFAAEPGTPEVCDGTGTMARLHGQGAICDGECEDPLQTQTHARLQLATCDATCVLDENGTSPTASSGLMKQVGKRG